MIASQCSLTGLVFLLWSRNFSLGYEEENEFLSSLFYLQTEIMFFCFVLCVGPDGLVWSMLNWLVSVLCFRWGNYGCAAFNQQTIEGSPPRLVPLSPCRCSEALGCNWLSLSCWGVSREEQPLRLMKLIEDLVVHKSKEQTCGNETAGNYGLECSESCKFRRSI